MAISRVLKWVYHFRNSIKYHTNSPPPETSLLSKKMSETQYNFTFSIKILNQEWLQSQVKRENRGKNDIAYNQAYFSDRLYKQVLRQPKRVNFNEGTLFLVSNLTEWCFCSVSCTENQFSGSLTSFQFIHVLGKMHINRDKTTIDLPIHCVYIFHNFDRPPSTNRSKPEPEIGICY